MPPKNYNETLKTKKYKVWSLYTIGYLRKGDLPLYRDTYLPVRPVRYYSLWNDIKLAWLVFRRKADAFIWESYNEK